jgi:hypothetical protein
MMAKLIINLDGPDALGLAYCIFKSKEDFDSDPYAGKGHQGLRYDWTPEKFPCLMFDCGVNRRENGPDEIKTLYIYDFNIVED